MKKSERKLGNVSAEVAVGIALAVVVLFIALGLFSDNLKQMSLNTKLSNVFNSDGAKFEYSKFGRDYSNSQINVQLTGEQGLEQLRRKANNKAIELIESPFSIANTKVNEIAYLAVAIKSIVGKPDICVYMNKDSNKFCDEDDIGGYNYLIKSIGANLVITRVAKTDGNGVLIREEKTLTLPLNSSVSSILSSLSVPAGSNGRSSLNQKQQYEFIINLSMAVKAYVDNSVLLLLKSFSTFKYNAIDATSTKLIADFKGLSSAVDQSANIAYRACSGDPSIFDIYLNYSNYGCQGYYRIEAEDYAKIVSWKSDLDNKFSALPSDCKVADVAKIFTDSIADGTIVSIIDNDNFHSENDDDANSASNIFNNGVNEINQKYSLNIEANCKPSGIKGLGIAATVGAASVAIVDFFDWLF